jgi:tetratricopeptide (TPR) repeat protein
MSGSTSILEQPQNQSSLRAASEEQQPSMTFALFFYWVIPVLMFAALSRFAVDTSVGTIPLQPASRPIQIKPRKRESAAAAHVDPPSAQPNAESRWPTAYRQVVQTIKGRRRRIELSGQATPSTHHDATSTQDQVELASPPDRERREQQDAARNQLHQKIALLQQQYEQAPRDIFIAISLADAMRFYEVQYHDGGSYETRAIDMYAKVVELALARRQKLLEQGKPADETASGMRNVNEEMALDYTERSAEGILCGVYTSQGKTFFLANMFERAVDSYTKCLKIEPAYLDALNARGSALIILGSLQEAGQDLVKVIEGDTNLLFSDAYQGLARVLQAKEEVVPGGWEALATMAKQLIPILENKLELHPHAKQLFATHLNRMYHALYMYCDIKTKDYAEAFRYLTMSYKHKLSLLPPWISGSELARIEQTRKIFSPGFWPDNIGSQNRVPIFIVGFVRSGSTLLERVLDSHPMIVGTGENSVFNGRLPEIRNQIVQQSMTSPEGLGDLTRRLADDVVGEMKRRWKAVDANTPNSIGDAIPEEPKRFVDKMLTNYYNIGFIQMLYPNALILHVVREPMDTIFSAYKHEFPPGTLDYTSDFEGLTELYVAYRRIMKHWDEVLPGRVTHVRYEDMVYDMPGVARAVIRATGTPWDESVLEFHKKKHAVNTLSTTQVRKGVYRDSLKSWMRYEKQLQPLIKMLGDMVDYDLQTSLPSYRAQEVVVE